MIMNDFFEKTLEDMIFEKRNSIDEKGLNVFYKNSMRQVYLPCGKKIDILTWEIDNDTIYARIIEIKREKIDEKAFWQSIEYYSELLTALSGYFKEYNLEVVLIGTGCSLNIRNAQHISNILRVFEYSYGFDGIMFIEKGYSYKKSIGLVKTFIPDEDSMPLIEKLKLII